MIMIWVIGFLFTLGILNDTACRDDEPIPFYLVVILLFLWPIMLGSFVNEMHEEKLAVLNEIKKNIEKLT